MKVLGLDKNRNVVEKDLDLNPDKGALLSYQGTTYCIERNLDFFNKLYRPWDGADGFQCAFVMVTNKCNKKCSYCYEQKMKVRHYGDPTVEELINITKNFIPDDKRDYPLGEYKDYKYDGTVPVIRLIGGEPTVFKGLADYLQWLVLNRMNRIVIYTNGIAMQDKKFFEKMPRSSKICWTLSIDSKTTDDFIRRWADNIIEYGGQNEYSFSIVIENTDWKTGIHQDKILITEYKPQEIRYRGISEQDGSKFSTATDVLDFITESRGIKTQTFLDHAKWHQQTLTCLKYTHTEQPNAGNIVAARLPVWNTVLVEEYCKQASFTMNTKHFWNTAEGHCGSMPLYIYRMTNEKIYKHPSHSLFWGKENPYTRRGFKN